ncbi:MAPEG family protein [Roseovarius sp.]|uniref:MAPEG family protein n=1 Tax=Roseovarius sp. TaxID=1486281 RepID=UPI003BAC2A3D
MPLTATPLYAGLLALLLVFLSFRVIFYRFSARISLGDEDDKNLRKRIRVQANCAEYAPFGVILLLLAELQGAPFWALHLLGGTLVAGRLLHAVGMGSTPQILRLRQAGMVLTFTMFMATALGLIGHALF